MKIIGHGYTRSARFICDVLGLCLVHAGVEVEVDKKSKSTFWRQHHAFCRLDFDASVDVALRPGSRFNALLHSLCYQFGSITQNFIHHKIW